MTQVKDGPVESWFYRHNEPLAKLEERFLVTESKIHDWVATKPPRRLQELRAQRRRWPRHRVRERQVAVVLAERCGCRDDGATRRHGPHYAGCRGLIAPATRQGCTAIQHADDDGYTPGAPRGGQGRQDIGEDDGLNTKSHVQANICDHDVCRVEGMAGCKKGPGLCA